jgi:hypothetical protein
MGKKKSEQKSEQKKEDRDDIVRTVSPLILGSIAGAFSYYITISGSRDPIGIIILVMFIYIHKFIFLKFKIEPKGKDWIVVSFLSFTMWYIIWTFLLNL